MLVGRLFCIVLFTLQSLVHLNLVQSFDIIQPNDPAWANSAWLTAPITVQGDQFTVTPANNNVNPSSSAVNSLNKINHFIILSLNRESYDAVFGVYPQGNNLLNPNPAIQPQIAIGQANANGIGIDGITGPDFTGQSWPSDAAGQVPNVPVGKGWFLYNDYYSETSPVSHGPKHEYIQCNYKINNGAMNGFLMSEGDKAGANVFGTWNLTGSNLWNIASQYQLFDKFFESARGGPLLGHMYLIGGRSVVWDNGRSIPPIVLDDNSTLAYGNYSSSNGILADMNQDAILTYPDNYLISDINSPNFCGPPFFPVIDDSSNSNTSANIGDQLIAAGISWAYYAEDWNDEVQDAVTGDHCDKDISANMLPFTHYARFNPFPASAGTSDWQTHLLDYTEFSTKLQAGQLESVVYLQPNKLHDWSAGDAAPEDSDVWLGQFWSNITNSPHWADGDTMVIVTWDLANGIYDHVPPYAGDQFGPGLRVATIVASPYHTGGKINSNPYEHYSIVKMIQRRFNLPMQDSTGYNPLMGQSRDTATRDFTNTFTDISGTNAASSINVNSCLFFVTLSVVIAYITMLL